MTGENTKVTGGVMAPMKVVLFSLFCFIGSVDAQTASQTLCFVSQKNRNIELVLRTYLDEELQKEIGAIAKYGTSRDTISLVYVGDGMSEESIEYELHWLEVFGGKITGEYRLLKPKMATVFGAYVKYKNFRTGQETTFSPSGKVGDQCIMTPIR